MATATATITAAEGQNGLKHLSFVPGVAEKAVNTAATVYSTSKSYVPANLKPRLEEVEERVSTISAPYVAKATDTSQVLLKQLDQKVSAGRAGPDHALGHTPLIRVLEPSCLPAR